MSAPKHEKHHSKHEDHEGDIALQNEPSPVEANHGYECTHEIGRNGDIEKNGKSISD